MRIGGRRIDVPRAILAALALAVLAGLVFGAATSTAAFGSYNPAWDGTSDLRELVEDAGAEPVIATNASEYRTFGENDIAFVIAPEETYGDRDAARVAGFVEDGGTLVVADRDGSGNELLAGVGADARVDGTPVRDERHYYRSPALPEATNVSEHNLTDGVDALTINHGTIVDLDSTSPEQNATAVLIRTSEFAYLDENRNEELDDNETMASMPVATAEDVGDGRVVVVSDPSAFINVMLERPGNRAFARNLIADADRVVIDVSHAGSVPPLIAVLLWVRGSAGLQLALAGLGLAAVFAWQRGVPTGRRSGGVEPPEGAESPSPALLGYLRREHPEYEERRLQRITKAVIGARRERDDDE